MKNTWRVGFSTLAGTVLVAGALAMPPAAKHQAAQAQQATPQTQSVSGKIASIDQSSFTITVGSGSSITQDAQKPAAASSTMTFAVDKNTTVEGSMKVGSTADVTYRQDGGTNVAISVHVTP
jgi:Cu/Ag efflux protein CusF